MIRNTLSRLVHSRLVPGAVGGLVVAAVLAGPGAWAAVTSSNPSASTTYTGCLGHTSGSIYDVQQGNAPLATCTTKDKQIKLSAGDITGVTAGTGLTGGAAKGAATVALAPAYQLPQSCPGDTSPIAGGPTGYECGDAASKGFAFNVASGGEQSVGLGFYNLDLQCGSSAATLSADNTFGDPGTINALVGTLGGAVNDIGGGVEAGGTSQIASNGGGTANFVWDEDGVPLTGTVTWYLNGPGGSCQFDGDLVRSEF